MRNELMMKTLPGAALQIYVLFRLPGLLLLSGAGGRWAGDEEKRTNELDYNEEELSQEIGRARISRAEAAGLLPASPRMWPLRLRCDFAGNRSGKIKKTSDHDCTGPHGPGRTLYVCWPRHPQSSIMVRHPSTPVKTLLTPDPEHSPRLLLSIS